MAKNTWRYANAHNTIAGTMICTCCRKRIVDGWFRYKETKDAYLAQHKACSLDDKTWATYDRQKEAREKSDKLLLEDAKIFRNKWGVGDLDGLIWDLENNT